MNPGPGPVRRQLARLLRPEYLDMAKVVCGTFSRNLFRGLFKLVIAGFLTPQGLGILRSVLSLFKILTSLAEFGLNYAMVTFVATALGKNDEEEKRRLMKAVLLMDILISFAVLTLGCLFAERLALWTLSDARLTIFVRMVCVAVGGQILWKFISSYLSSHQYFGRLAIFLTTAPLLMLSAAVALGLFGRLDVTTGIVISLFAPMVTMLLWWPTLPRGILSASIRGRGVISRIVRFSRWIYVTNVASATRNNANTLLLKSPALSGSLAAGETNAGLYSFGSDLANEITVFTESLLTVLLPKASNRTNAVEMKRFLRRSYRHLALLIVPLLLLMFLAKPLIHVLGFIKISYLEYLPSLPIFMILYTGAMFSLAAIPMKAVVYALNLPKVESYLEMLMLVILFVGGFALIPRYGGSGAATVVLVQRLLTFVLIVGYGLFKLNRLERDGH